MKKLLLISLVLCIGMLGYSQSTTSIDKYKTLKMDDGRINYATDDATNFNNPVNMVKGSGLLDPVEADLGTTWYDLFSNYNDGNRFWRFEDGTMSAVWIYGTAASQFPERGTGYNYYDGTAWGPAPTMRIENTRTGWPNISSWGDGEMGVAHNGSDGLEFIKREVKGTGEWTQWNFLGPAGIESSLTWPRMVASGVNNEYTHLFSPTNAEYAGQIEAVVYSRSDDGGETWDPHNVVLPEMGEENYREVVHDCYALASNGPHIGLVYSNITADLFYMISHDNGETWERVVVWEHPIPFYDPAVQFIDTVFCPDRSGHMAIDNDGHVHVVFAITRYQNSEATGAVTYPYHPDWEGIVYWNDEMEPFSNDLNALAPPKAGQANSELIEGVNYIGEIQDVDGSGTIEFEGILPLRCTGISTWPAIHVDDQGRRFLIFSSVTETFVYTGGSEPQNYRHIWARGYENGSWGEFMDLNTNIAHVFDDCVYPMIGNTSDANIHYIYQADISPGNALDGDHDYQENRWIYGMLPKTDLLTGIGEEQELINSAQVSQNFPNPFNGSTKVQVQLETPSELSLVITNLTGQKVIELNKGYVPAQTHTFTIDATTLQSGVYFYTVTAGSSQVTKKMIVE